MNRLVILLPLLPLFAALSIGSAHFFRLIDGEAGEKLTHRITIAANTVVALWAIALWLMALAGQIDKSYVAGVWLESGAFRIALSLTTQPLNLGLASLFSLLWLIVMRFAVNYMHREAGFHRFFFCLNLFAAAMMLLVLSGNAVGTFIGWELAGVCSYLLIAYAYDRPVAANNATRVFITNRIGDAGLLLGIGLSLLWLGSCDWQWLNLIAERRPDWQVTTLACCFALAACAKSAQVPFTPWLARAMEGPTPSSAVFYGGVMVHAGVFLLIQLQPLFEHAPVAMALLVAMGSLTAIYSYWVGLTQTDIKSSLVFATATQLGLMFLECGLGWWTVATWHLAAHAVVRCYLFLTAPSIMHITRCRPMPPVKAPLSRWHGAFIASLQRGWLELAGDCLLVKPIQSLATDLQAVETRFFEPILGAPAPALRAISSLAQLEEHKMGARLNNDADQFAQGSGLAGKLAQWTAAVAHWFEARFILYDSNGQLMQWGRGLGYTANRFEALLLQPRYLVLFVLISLLIALSMGTT